MIRLSALPIICQPHVPNFADPLSLMSYCYRKIEGFLAGLAVAGEKLGRASREELAESFRLIDAAREHFAVRGPKHTEDEELSLFPRLRRDGGHEALEALAALAALETEHRVAEEVHAEFDELVARLPRDGSATVKEIVYFQELVAGLSDLYQPHIIIEDELIFPTAARVLSPKVLLVIGQEMRARRRDILMRVSGEPTHGAQLSVRG